MKKFIKNNESFHCKNCNSLVIEHPSSSRDHCSKCLYGLHVDINPGDRMNNCKSLMKPIGIRMKNGKKQIVYDCMECKDRFYCVVAEDDNKEIILDLVSKVWK
jgi:hypothetical protein